jgi:tetratricopeptide (TPR) repeat protein
MVPDQLFGRYRVIEQIGAGGMGVVYRAHDERLERDVALKVLPPGAFAGETARRRFRREALALSRLNHPNIAVVHDFDTVDGVDALVMELVPGVTLNERVRSGPLPEAQVLNLGAQLAAGLNAAHERGIVHRDVKPGNLRVTPDGRLKILDFGLARLAEPDSPHASTHTHTAGEPGHPPGTLLYTAPEQLQGSPPAPATDIYAAGITLYELVTGRAPFNGPQAVVIEQILNKIPEPPSSISKHVSRELDAIILKAIDKRPERRYQTARELQVDLERCGEAAPAPRRRAWSTRRRVINAAAVLAIVVATAVWRVGSRPEPPSFPARGWVVLADFANRTDDPALDETVRESLRVALQQSAYLNVMSREQVIAALGRMRRADVVQVDEALGLEVCRRDNAQLLLAGTVVQSGAAIRITARALAADGRLLFAETAELTRREDLFARMDDLARRVRERLGEALRVVSQSAVPLDNVTTTSLDALRQYSQAVDLIARGAMGEARQPLQAAVALDPQFAMARRQLARVFQAIGDRDQQVRQLAAAFAARQDVTPRERYFIEAAYYTSLERYDDAVESLRLLATLHPDDTEALYDLAMSQYAIGRLAEAIDATRAVLRIRPAEARAHEMLVLLLARDGREEEALKAHGQAVSTVDDTDRLRWGVGMALLGLGRTAEARQSLTALASGDGPYAGTGAVYLARADLLDGRLDDAAARLERDAAEDARTGRASPEMLRRWLLARVHLVRGESGDAEREAQRVVAAAASGAVAHDLLQAGLVLATVRNFPAARDVLRRLERIAEASPSSFTRSSLHHLRGALALEERRIDAAAAALRAALAEFQSPYSHAALARAREAQGQWEEARASWQAVIAARGHLLRDGFPPDLVEAHVQLGRVHERLGERALARRQYEAALGWWKGPSSGVRMLDEARASLQRVASASPGAGSPVTGNR